MSNRALALFIFVILLLAGCGGDSSTGPTTAYQVSISAIPSEGGTVSPSGGQYEEGETVEISAESSEGWRFVEWEGDYSGKSSMATITVSSNMNIQAKFTKREYALTINTNGEGTVDEEVIQTKSTDYEHDTLVELTANPADGWEFIEWQGDLTSSENPERITVDQAKEVTAVFEQTGSEPETAFPGQTGEITTIEVNGVELTVEKFGEVYVYQGDIIIDPKDYENIDQNRNKLNKFLPYSLGNTWPDNTLSYVFDEGVSEKFKNLIDEGIRMITENTNVNIHQRYDEYNYIIFKPITGSSKVGGSSKIGNIPIIGKQKIRVSINAPVGTVAHEIMHALGLLHEQSRTDRDEYIEVISENIRNKRKHNFDKSLTYHPEASYDYQSIMHYGSWAFSQGGATITKKDGSTFTANRDFITQNDIEKINDLYPIEPPTINSTSSTPNPSNPGEKVNFTADITGDEPIDCKWNFGNGDTSNKCTTTYTYQNKGTYNVSLKASNEAGSDTKMLTQKVEQGGKTKVIAWGDFKSDIPDIPTNVKNAKLKDIKAGIGFGLGLTKDGRVVAWGGNDQEVVKDLPNDLKNVIAIDAGLTHAIALKRNGIIVAWGDNSKNQTNVPSNLKNVIKISASSDYNLALKSNGKVVGWGSDDRVLHPTGTLDIPKNLKDVVDITAGPNYSIAILKNGKLRAWGAENITGFTGEVNVPAGLDNVKKIAAGNNHVLALKENGKVIGWGSNKFWHEATPPENLRKVTDISAGLRYSMALKKDGTVSVWGKCCTDIPSDVKNVLVIDAGAYYCMAIIQK